MDWDRLITLMIRQCLNHPAEFLTFNRLSCLIPDADVDVLHSIAELRNDLFVITINDHAVKLIPLAVEQILTLGEQQVITTGVLGEHIAGLGHEPMLCPHYSEGEILEDLQRCSLPPDALTRNCCWRQICRVRGQNQNRIDAESWREICIIRGYLLERQNPRGF